MKDPDEPMFTLTAMDKHGVEYNGRVRRLMPKECFRLQGFADEQFDKLVEVGIPESQLYKMAGNSVTTNVVTAIAKKLIKEIRKYDGGDDMPNHVINQVKFECPEEKLKEILSAICYGEDSEAQTKGIGTIDFNKIIPMPESLNIESGSYTDRGIDFYLTSVNPQVTHLGDEKLSPEEFDTLVNELNSRRFFYGSYRTALTPEEIAEESQYKSTDELIALGKTAIYNIQNYGAATWYDWRTRGDTWNTKWNSYNSADYEGGNEICFQTAWSPPHPILMRISEMFPGVYITHQWADEDLGCNCGAREYLNGECVGDIVPQTDKDSLEFAASVWGYDLNELGLTLSASGNSYVNIENEDYDLVAVDNKPALFSNGRLTLNDIPQGLFLYHLRSSDDGDRFCSLEAKVGVNHGGSIVTSEPLDLGEKGYIAFTDDNSPNFMGEQITFAQFMEGDFETKEAINIE